MRRIRAALGREDGVTLAEMLIVIVMLSIIGTAITGVVITTMRAHAFTEDRRQVSDEARWMFERIRKELRAGRRVYDTSCATPGCTQSGTLHFWVDHNQDGLQQTTEQITYETRAIVGQPGKFEIVRYDAAVGPGAALQIASTLVNNQPFVFDMAPPNTRFVTLDFDLDVNTTSGPLVFEVETTIRLRNVA